MHRKKSAKQRGERLVKVRRHMYAHHGETTRVCGGTGGFEILCFLRLAEPLYMIQHARKGAEHIQKHHIVSQNKKNLSICNFYSDGKMP